MSSKVSSHNFQFLAAYDMQLVRLGALAENYFQDDPNTCVIKLWQFGELLAQQVAARTGVYISSEAPQTEVLRRLRLERIVPREALDLFHQIRIVGNRATHEYTGSHAELVYLTMPGGAIRSTTDGSTGQDGTYSLFRRTGTHVSACPC